MYIYTRITSCVHEVSKSLIHINIFFFCSNNIKRRLVDIIVRDIHNKYYWFDNIVFLMLRNFRLCKRLNITETIFPIFLLAPIYVYVYILIDLFH